MKRAGVLRGMAYGAEFLLLYLLQQVPGLFPEISHSLPVLLIPAVVTAAFFEEEVPSMVCGLFCGLLMDFGSGSFLGAKALEFAVGGYCVSFLASQFLKTNLLSAVVSTLALGGILALLQWIFTSLFPGNSESGYLLFYHLLPRVLYTAIFAAPLYYLNRFLATRLRTPADT